MNVGSGLLGSGAQSLRASETSTKPVRSVSDGWPVKLVMVSISSRREGTSRRSTFGEDPRHLERDLAAETIGLDEVDGREEAGLAEDVGPGVGDLHLELVDPVRLRVSSSKAAAASAKRMGSSES